MLLSVPDGARTREGCAMAFKKAILHRAPRFVKYFIFALKGFRWKGVSLVARPDGL
jgi:hypothetical protein